MGKCNNAERECIGRLEDEGFEVLTNGWPDLVAVRGDEVRVIEVKPLGRSGLSPRQARMASALKKLGIIVEVYEASTWGVTKRRRDRKRDRR